jgi:Zn-dependent metalloprotease
MNEPTKDKISIDHFSEYFDGYNVHYTSGIFNKAFYLLSLKPSWNVPKAFKVWVNGPSSRS